MPSSTTPRIYVASLSDYNAGNLHGVWINATKDPDDIEAEIRAMLFQSKDPNVERCTRCGMTRSTLGATQRECNAPASLGLHAWRPSAEEYAIHDYEGFGGIKLSEFESIERVSELANAIEEHGEIFAKFWEHSDEKADVSDAVSDFRDRYQGAYSSLEDYAEQFLEDTGAFQGAPDLCRHYFDFETFARDLELGGDVFTISLDGEVHVFDGH